MSLRSGGQHSGNVRATLDVVASIAMIVASVVVIWAVFRPQSKVVNSARPNSTQAAIPADPVRVDGPTQGDPRAPIGVIEFSDFQCPFCSKFASDVLPALIRDYVRTGRVLLAFRHFPLQTHARAFAAAEAAQCAGRQGKFWEMHDALFANPGALEETALVERSRALGIDQDAFRQCLRGETAEQVRADIAAARRLGITGTPTFLIGRLDTSGRAVTVRYVLNGAQSAAAFTTVFTQVLNTR